MRTTWGSLVALSLACGGRSVDPWSSAGDGGVADGDSDGDSDVDADSDSDGDCVLPPSPWRAETPDPDGFAWPVLGIAPDDSPGVLYVDLDWNVHYARRREAGWALDRLGVNALNDVYAGLAFDAGGAAHTALAGLSGIGHASDESGAWQVATIPGESGWVARAAVSSADHVHVLIVGADFLGMRDATRTEGQWTVRSVTDDAIHNFDAAVGSDGTLHIAYVTPDWQVRYGTDAAGEWALQSLDSDLGSSEFQLLNMSTRPRVALFDDAAFVAYHAVSELRWARIDADGSVSAAAVSTARFAAGGQEDSGVLSLSYAFEPPSTFHITYVVDTPTGRDIHYARNCGEEWADEVARSDTALSAGPESWANLTVGPDAGLHVVYSDVVEIANQGRAQLTYLRP